MPEDVLHSIKDMQCAGGQGVLGEDMQARTTLTQAASTALGAEPLGPALDYLITCSYSPSADQLLLLAGNNAGAAGCFPVLEPANVGTACGLGGPQTVMSGAHDAVSTCLADCVPGVQCLSGHCSQLAVAFLG